MRKTKGDDMASKARIVTHTSHLARPYVAKALGLPANAQLEAIELTETGEVLVKFTTVERLSAFTFTSGPLTTDEEGLVS